MLGGRTQEEIARRLASMPPPSLGPSILSHTSGGAVGNAGSAMRSTLPKEIVLPNQPAHITPSMDGLPLSHERLSTTVFWRTMTGKRWFAPSSTTSSPPQPHASKRNRNSPTSRARSSASPPKKGNKYLSASTPQRFDDGKEMTCDVCFRRKIDKVPARTEFLRSRKTIQERNALLGNSKELKSGWRPKNPAELPRRRHQGKLSAGPGEKRPAGTPASQKSHRRNLPKLRQKQPFPSPTEISEGPTDGSSNQGVTHAPLPIPPGEDGLTTVNRYTKGRHLEGKAQRRKQDKALRKRIDRMVEDTWTTTWTLAGGKQSPSRLPQPSKHGYEEGLDMKAGTKVSVQGSIRMPV